MNLKIMMVHPHDVYSPMEPWTVRIMKLADELANKGHDVTVAYFPMMPSPRSTFRNIPIIPLNRRISLVSMAGNYAALLRLARCADIVHLQKCHFYAAIPVIAAAFMANTHLHYDWDDWEEKIFFSSVGRTTPSTFLTGCSFWLLERCLPLLADSISVASTALKDLAIRRGANKRALGLVPVGADLQQFQPGRDGAAVRGKYGLGTKVVVLYHGQLHSCQYVKLFLQAARTISERDDRDRFSFMVVGSGSELGALKDFVRELGIEDMVIFTGFVSHTEVPDHIAAADICVASFEDNEVTRCKSPLKIVEYLAAGKPVVASGVGEAKNMLNGSGLIVQPGRSEDIASAIIKLAEDAAMRMTLSVAARKMAEEKYNWRHSAAALERVYVGGL